MYEFTTIFLRLLFWYRIIGRPSACPYNTAFTVTAIFPIAVVLTPHDVTVMLRTYDRPTTVAVTTPCFR